MPFPEACLIINVVLKVNLVASDSYVDKWHLVTTKVLDEVSNRLRIKHDFCHRVKVDHRRIQMVDHWGVRLVEFDPAQA
jgi:hypothetical protein